ncbi:HAD family hydrolase [Alkaliphilus peptidifermentans]|uniref:Phosphoglycolate phosphatase n=1 Tax=Alkaliphilus peptidifermentans DSM 18978 TaxID=1120976 RepID=A0A1G5LDV7_9FIRM|nr:HAD family hydrolase [Alkaliphilus peptidifermentans]SCZ10430.1 phosphoglycolate phosphatase [Alkaliphilus peptidifermentans DSM 18978]
MKKEYRYILFDLDGTLTDPKVGITKGVQYALAKYGIKEDDLDKLESFIGPPLLYSFKEFYSFDSEKATEAIKYYREYFSEKGMFENIPYNGIRRLLEGLMEEGKILIVATSKPTYFAEKILKYFELEEFFTLIAGSNLDGSRCEKDEVIQYIREIIPEITCNNTIMVGDRKYDIIGAKQHHIESIGVTYGYGGEEELKAAEATFIVTSIEELNVLLTNR